MDSNGTSLANDKCGDTYTYQFPAGEGRAFFCRPSLKGRFVIIRLIDKDKPLTLCEVEVYSERRGISCNCNSYFSIIIRLTITHKCNTNHKCKNF